MDVDIREFAEGDRAAVVGLWDRCGLTRPWNDPDRDVDRKVRRGGGPFLVATIGDEVVGSVMAGYDGHRGWINYLAVDPGRQGHEIGRRLMLAAEQGLAALGCPKVNLQIRRTNLDARSFYERLGYVEDDVISMGRRLAHDDED